MTECFLPPSSSPAEQRRADHPGGVARTPSSEEISPTKFPGLYRTGEPSPPHDGHHHEPPDPYVSDDDKEHSKKKNKFKKKEKRNLTPFLPRVTAEGYAAFQEDSSADEAESPSKMKRSKGIHVFKKPSFSKKKEKDFKVKEKGPKEDKAKEKKSKDLTAADVVKQWKEKKKKKKPASEAEPVPVETPTVRPIFGAPLAEAVKRTALYDGIQLPAIFRECVDYIENYGMKCEGIYRVSDEWDHYLPLGLPQLAFESRQDSLDLPEPLLLGQVLHARLQVSVQAVEQELLDTHLHWVTLIQDHELDKHPGVKHNNKRLAGMVAMLDQRSGRTTGFRTTSPNSSFTWECESKIAQEIASLSKEDVSKEEMTENEEEVINLLLAQENEILTEQEELIALEQVLRRQIATEKEEIERLRAEIADIQSRQQGRSETEEYSSDSESESEDEEELQMILEDLQKQNEELENKNTHLNQAIHEEQEAILELRVQLRLLQSHKQQQQQELTVPPPAEQAPPTQPSPEARSEEQTKRSISTVAATGDAPAPTNGKPLKDPSKPSPSKDRRDTNM
ncbi:hypothetical protein CCH79_00009661 [Gambusia affinis]|uniref:Rho-GAP domain-containing protein n=1 Tax=Gambusia affinis TaxID=33528 RepID=A0A315W315_GAMAF|nr:hypothetical protein CCH79_00009661 [Gambusia affinis]